MSLCSSISRAGGQTIHWAFHGIKKSASYCAAKLFYVACHGCPQTLKSREIFLLSYMMKQLADFPLIGNEENRLLAMLEQLGPKVEPQPEAALFAKDFPDLHEELLERKKRFLTAIKAHFCSIGALFSSLEASPLMEHKKAILSCMSAIHEKQERPGKINRMACAAGLLESHLQDRIDFKIVAAECSWLKKVSFADEVIQNKEVRAVLESDWAYEGIKQRFFQSKCNLFALMQKWLSDANSSPILPDDGPILDEAHITFRLAQIIGKRNEFVERRKNLEFCLKTLSDPSPHSFHRAIDSVIPEIKSYLETDSELYQQDVGLLQNELYLKKLKLEEAIHQALSFPGKAFEFFEGGGMACQKTAIYRLEDVIQSKCIPSPPHNINWNLPLRYIQGFNFLESGIPLKKFPVYFFHYADSQDFPTNPLFHAQGGCVNKSSSWVQLLLWCEEKKLLDSPFEKMAPQELKRLFLDLERKILGQDVGVPHRQQTKIIFPQNNASDLKELSKTVRQNGYFNDSFCYQLGQIHEKIERWGKSFDKASPYLTQNDWQALCQVVEIPPLPDEIDPCLDQFFATLHQHMNDPKLHPFQVASFILWSILKIRPLSEQNEQLARLFSSLYLMQKGFLPFIVFNESEFRKLFSAPNFELAFCFFLNLTEERIGEKIEQRAIYNGPRDYGEWD